jgi:hypothetical protein
MPKSGDNRLNILTMSFAKKEENPEPYTKLQLKNFRKITPDKTFLIDDNRTVLTKDVTAEENMIPDFQGDSAISSE